MTNKKILKSPIIQYIINALYILNRILYALSLDNRIFLEIYLLALSIVYSDSYEW